MQKVQNVTNQKEGSTRSESRRLRSVLDVFIEQVSSSPLGHVELDGEPAIRDFIVDLMLKSMRLVAGMRAVLEVAGLGGGKVELDVVRDNIKALFGGKLSRRMNRTLLHEAARDGAERLVELTMVVLVKVAEAVDGDAGGGENGGESVDGTTPHLKQTGSTVSSHARRGSVISKGAEAKEDG